MMMQYSEPSTVWPSLALCDKSTVPPPEATAQPPLLQCILNPEEEPPWPPGLQNHTHSNLILVKRGLSYHSLLGKTTGLVLRS